MRDNLDRRCPPGFICVHEPRCPGAANPPEPPAAAVTDQQLHDLMDALLIEDIRAITGADYRECKLALGLLSGTTKQRQRQARARCAELIKARKAASSDHLVVMLEIEGPPSPVDMETIARRAMFSGRYAYADHVARIMWRWWTDRALADSDEHVTRTMWWLGFMAATGQTNLGAITSRAHALIKGA